MSFSGTVEERIAVETACSYGSKAEAYSSPTAEDVSIEVTMDGEGPKMGRDAELTITLQNSSSQHREVILHSQLAVMYYTGVHKATVRKDRTDVDLLPNEGEWSFSVSVGYREVLPYRCPSTFIPCENNYLTFDWSQSTTSIAC